MKVLIFNIEHYLPYEQESQNYLARLPIIHCGLDITYRDHVHQRELRSAGPEAALRSALAAVEEFAPDVIVYFQCWNDEDLPRCFFDTVRARGIKVMTFIWDSNVMAHETEIELFRNSDCLLVDTFDSYLRWRFLARVLGYAKHISIVMGYYYYDGPKGPTPEMPYDVTLLGSIEGHRLELLNYLAPELERRGIRFFKGGGCLDMTRGASGFDNTWLSWEDYTRIIRGSRICLNSQSSIDRLQIKGKVFEILARGGFCLTDDNSEYRRLFPAGTVPCYQDKEDCLRQILHFLENEGERERIRTASVAWYEKNFDCRTYYAGLLRYIVEGGERPQAMKFLEDEFDFVWNERAAVIPILADTTTSLIKFLHRTADWPQQGAQP